VDSYLLEGLQNADKTKMHPKAKLQNAPTFYPKWKPFSCLFTVTVTVTKVFILRFLLKDQKCITESFTYTQRSPG